jgi:hypothetical protein
MKNFSIFLRGSITSSNYLFSYDGYDGTDYEGDTERLAAEPRNKAQPAVTDRMQIPFPGQSGLGNKATGLSPRPLRRSRSRYFRNIAVMAEDKMYSFIAPTRRQRMQEVDYNCFFERRGAFSSRVSEVRKDSGPSRKVQRSTLDESQALGFEKDSIVADPLFEDASERNFSRAT